MESMKLTDDVLEEIHDIKLTDIEAETVYSIGSAKHDKYCDERGGWYGIELTTLTLNMNNPEHMKLLDALMNLRDDKDCRYSVEMR